MFCGSNVHVVRITDEKLLHNSDLLNASINIVDMSGLPISDLSALPELPRLRSLDCSYTLLISFAGAKSQPSLKEFNCKQTPLGNSAHLRLMSVIIFGSSLQFVNGRKIAATEYQSAAHLGPIIKDDLLNGYILLDRSPIRLVSALSGDDKIKKTSHKKRNTKHLPEKAAAQLVVDLPDSCLTIQEDPPKTITDPIAVLQIHRRMLQRMESSSWNSRRLPFTSKRP